MAVQCGLSLNTQHPPGDALGRFRDTVAQVRLARDLGFALVGAPQHYLADPYQQFQPVPLLARLATEAPGLRLLTQIILLPLQRAVDVAEQLATLDAMCEGRLIAGVGIGYRDVEDRGLGLDPAERVARFEENVVLLRRLWTEDRVTHHSRHCHLDDVRPLTRPAQQPHPPIWIAGNADGGVRRAARLGDSWLMNPHSTLRTLARQLKLYREALAALGKPLPAELPVCREVFIAADRAAAYRIAEPYLAAKYASYVAWGQDTVQPRGDSLDRPFEELWRDRFVIGDPAECLAELQRYREVLGVDRLMLRVHWPGMPQEHAREAIRLLGQRVLPRLR